MAAQLKRKEQDSEDSATANKAPKIDSEGRFWAWTYFQEDGEYVNFPASVNTLIHTQKTTKKIKYLVYQEEKCPETGRLHLQGFMILFEKTKKSVLCKNFPMVNLRLRYAQSTNQAAADYCKKADSATGKHKYEGGEFEEDAQGKRNDLAVVMEAIKDGANLKAIAGNFGATFIKYHAGIGHAHRLLNAPKERDAPAVLLVYGPPGCGKTEMVKQIMRSLGDDGTLDHVYIPETNNSARLSFEEYAGQQIIWLDEFAGKEALDVRSLLLLTDRGMTKLPGRQHCRNAEHTHVFITANEPPETWGYAPVHVDALCRRVRLEVKADYDKWEIIDNKSEYVPKFLADAGSLNSSNSVFNNPVRVCLGIPCVKPRPRNSSASSRSWIMPPLTQETESTSDEIDENTGYNKNGDSLADKYYDSQSQFVDLTDE